MPNKILRIINNKGYTAHTDPLFKKSEILKLKDLYECEVCLFRHDYKNNKLTISFTEIFTRNHNSQLRNDLTLVPNFHSTNFLQFGMD